MKRYLLSGVMFLITIASLAQTNPQLQLYASGFSQPVDIVNAADSRLFVVEKKGIIRIIDSTGQVLPTPFLNIDPRVGSNGNEQGLLGLAFHPNYAQNGYFYVNYTNNSGETTISRFRVKSDNPNEANSTSEQILLTINQPYTNHNGGDLIFGPDGYLYIGTGDGGSGGDPQNRAQNRQELLGKMLRINVNSTSAPYSIPIDNPFINDTIARPEIWALGLRNPWRFSFDRLTGDLWIADVGQSSWEEVNMRPADSKGGENFGWRCYEGNSTYNDGGCPLMGTVTFPIHVYANQGVSGQGCSVTGGYVYRGNQYPALYGQYIYTDYCSGRFWALYPDSTGNWINTEWLNSNNNEFVAFGEDKDGELYVAGIGTGNIFKIAIPGVTALEDDLQIERLVVAPNPAADFVNIEMDVKQPAVYQFRLLDATARTITAFQESVGTGFNRQLSLKNLASGVYFLQIQRGKQTLVRKIQKY